MLPYLIKFLQIIIGKVEIKDLPHLPVAPLCFWCSASFIFHIFLHSKSMNLNFKRAPILHNLDSP